MDPFRAFDEFFSVWVRPHPANVREQLREVASVFWNKAFILGTTNLATLHEPGARAGAVECARMERDNAVRVLTHYLRLGLPNQNASSDVDAEIASAVDSIITAARVRP